MADKSNDDPWGAAGATTFRTIDGRQFAFVARADVSTFKGADNEVKATIMRNVSAIVELPLPSNN